MRCGVYLLLSCKVTDALTSTAAALTLFPGRLLSSLTIVELQAAASHAGLLDKAKGVLFVLQTFAHAASLCVCTFVMNDPNGLFDQAKGGGGLEKNADPVFRCGVGCTYIV